LIRGRDAALYFFFSGKRPEKIILPSDKDHLFSNHTSYAAHSMTSTLASSKEKFYENKKCTACNTHRDIIANTTCISTVIKT